MHRVIWDPEALDELAALWMEAGPDARRAITAAVDTLDRQLQSDPYLHSESRGAEDERRIQFAYPLAIHFRADPERRVVRVSHVRRFRRRGEPNDF